MTTSAISQVETPAAISGTSGQKIDDHAEPIAKAFKKYIMYYTTSRFNARLHLGSKETPALYYFETNISQAAPQFLLRKGDSKMAKMVNFAKLRNSTRHILIGKGDFKRQPEGELIWEELRRDKDLMHRSDYQVGTAPGSVTGRRAEFFWRKDKEARLKTVFDCLDESGRVIAKLLSGGSFNWIKGAEIEVIEGLDQELEQFLIMCALAIWGGEGRGFRSLFGGFNSSQKA